jgi:hypothetical protein
MAEAKQRLSSFAPTGLWAREASLEKEVHIDATGFVCEGAPLPTAFVWLTWDAENAEVSNIVPKETSSLSDDEYNAIADAFVEDVVNPLIVDLPLQLTLGRAEETLDDLLSSEAAAALRQFSGAANKSTGAAHPHDAARWHEFLICAHTMSPSIDASDLEDHLVSDLGWSPDMALTLAIQFEQGLELLRAYDARVGKA